MEERRQLVYLLRLWQVQGQAGVAWRASLQDARGGERRGYGSVEALCAYLIALAHAPEVGEEGLQQVSDR